MFSKKIITRRAGLLGGSALAAAGVVALAFSGAALAPSAALAASECGDPSANGATADTFACSGTKPSISYPATNGNLTLNLEGSLVVTGGISVTPTGTNAVTIARPFGQNDTTPAPGDPQISNSAGAAINVERTTGGSISFDLQDNNDFSDAPMIVTGTTAGIRTRNAGSSFTTITLGTGNEDLIDMQVTATAGAGIDAATTGTGGITITNGAIITGTTAAISISSGNTVTITQGGTNSFAPKGEIQGRIVLNNTGTTTFTNNGAWAFDGVSTLRNTTTATGGASITNTSLIATGAAATINWGVGVTATLTNSAFLASGTVSGPSTLTLQGLRTWNNRGGVFFGMGELLQSDGEANDRIVLSNSSFIANFDGTLASLLVMDVDFTASQSSCAAAVTADCLDLRGHRTSGSTAILVNSVVSGLTAERIVLVDVAGAGADIGVFEISEQSPGYRALGNGMVDGGLFLYEITHDTTAKQYALTVSGVDEEAVELTLAARAGLVAWDTATATWFDRQTDLRTSLRGGDGGFAPGGWLRVAAAFANQDMVSALDIGGASVDVLTHHTQDTLAVVGGVDVAAFSDGESAVVAGFTFGQVQSDLQFTESPNGIELDGYSYGAYASYVGPGFFLDGIINATNLDARFDGPSLGLDLEGDAESIGYRLEAGLRLAWGDGVYLEPLAAIAYVRSDLGDMPISAAVSAEFDRFTSLRGALGARLSGDVEFSDLVLQFAGTTRVWKEIEGESTSRIVSSAGGFEFLDRLEDTTGEVGVSLGLFGMGGRLSTQLSSAVKFRRDYQSAEVSLGARYQW